MIYFEALKTFLIKSMYLIRNNVFAVFYNEMPDEIQNGICFYDENGSADNGFFYRNINIVVRSLNFFTGEKVIKQIYEAIAYQRHLKVDNFVFVYIDGKNIPTYSGTDDKKRHLHSSSFVIVYKEGTFH